MAGKSKSKKNTTAQNETDIVETTTADESAPKKRGRIPMARVFNEDGSTMLITDDVESVTSYVNGFLNLPVKERKGYDNYWAKEDGFTNPQSVGKITPQGIGKMLAILHYEAVKYLERGGQQCDEMKRVLDGIEAYKSVAAQAAREHAEVQKQINAAQTVAKAQDISIEEAAKMIGYDYSKLSAHLPKPQEAVEAEVEEEAVPV